MCAQSDTSESDTIVKSIIQFYEKAEKYDKLVTYLISQSQSCVEHRGDYKSAVKYLKDASSISTKLNGVAAKEIKRLIGDRVSTIEWFQYAQETYETMDQLSLEDLCNDLTSPQSNQIIRAGDCYALLVKYFFALEKYQCAYDYLQTMQERGLDPYDFVERSTVKKILQSVGSEGSSDDESMM
jgi:tetratricopeptide (TPR) repeat protein